MGVHSIKKRKICVVTGSRADYGYLHGLMRAIALDPALVLQVIVTGAHLSKEYGLTYRQILRDGFKIDRKLNILKYDNTSVGVTKSLGLACSLFAEALSTLKPDIVVVLGDRYEMLAAVTAAHVAAIPIAHIHGGETSQGAMDEAFRHAITKMAAVHFAATEEYRRRIIQLGENPKRVFNFGSPGLEMIGRKDLLNKEQLAKALNFDLSGQVALLTYHPVTLEKGSASKQIDQIFDALMRFPIKAVLTKANADPGGREINKCLERIYRKYPRRFKLVDHLGQEKYYSCMRVFDLVIGNSSSGIIEAASFKTPVVNIGDRQKGRISARNVIHVSNAPEAIAAGIRKAISPEFRRSLAQLKNPYQRFENGSVSRKIKDKLKTISLNEGLLKKLFYDIPIKGRTT